MKKNKMLRIASVLLVAVLISTCAISGTFAKYVTKASGEDAARVAKWGIILTLEGEDVFLPEYAADDNTYNPIYADPESESTVLAANATDKLVAPGTKNDGYKATVTGTPEVAVRYALKLSDIVVPVLKKDAAIKDYTQLVKLEAAAEEATTTEGQKADTADATAATYGYADYTVKADYYPVLFTLAINNTKLTFHDADELLEAFEAIDKLADGVQYDEDNGIIYVDFSPNTELAGVTFQLSWAWAFENDVEDVDILDTYLGNEEELQTVSFKFEASATQID